MADVSPGGAPAPETPVPQSAPESPVPQPPAPEWVVAPPAAPQTTAVAAPVALAGVAPAETADGLLARERRKNGWRRWLPMAGIITFLMLVAIGLLLFLGVRMGPAALAIGLIAAVLPVPLLVGAFLWLDRYEPNPLRYLAFCFVWGAVVATSVALGVNTLAANLFDRWGLSDSLVAVLVAPFIEESMKALGPILLLWRRRADWSGITDGIVYVGLSALGFAMVENVLYLGGHGYQAGVEQYGPATGLMNLFAVFIVRILFTGFAHPLFTSMTGIGLGISSRSADRRVRWLAPIAGLLAAMMLHGTFNLLPTLTVKFEQPLIMLYGYLGFMVPLFFAVLGFAIALRSWEGRLTERILPYYVRTGWFAPPEVAALGSLGRRHSARQWAKRVSGDAGQRAMRSFQSASTQLALLRDGLQRGLTQRPEDLSRAQLQEQRLLSEITGYRTLFNGRDPQTPRAFWNGADYQIAFPDGVTRTVAAPDEPVVPVPVSYAPQPVYGGYPGYPGYGPPPFAAAPYAYQPAPSYPQMPASPYGQPSAPPYGQPPVSYAQPTASPYAEPPNQQPTPEPEPLQPDHQPWQPPRAG
ncbi:PrsW family intramembrane metalloprotease [Actinoplanes sp. TBRC 11911]|uniref:PrsW family intramembrane metalloprotease n=1 Tax=Actinoplanes sp. TBRC 11911 TaxID=2729386 RepID=UPI00145C9AE4|nr:PrsW family intramembrane metalloprotease [Actinoplanes sp. TBRC 11911]NMO52054.1 PrsW family intramembrane metalloprotease [Actinoplanes sp. TBRC 11911]